MLIRRRKRRIEIEQQTTYVQYAAATPVQAVGSDSGREPVNGLVKPEAQDSSRANTEKSGEAL